MTKSKKGIENMSENKVKPITITLPETGEVYTLEFNREAVAFAERRGFNASAVGDFPTTLIPEMFFYAFRMHHKNVARSKADKILEEMGGVTKELMERLSQLYFVPINSIIRVDDEDVPKNSRVIVEL